MNYIKENNNKAIIFDFDGTIANTYQHFIEIGNRLAGEFNYHTVKSEEVDFLKYRSSREIIKYLNIPILKIPAIIARIKKELNNNITSIELFRGIKEVLYQLNKLNVFMGIVSSNSEENIQQFLIQHGIDIFDVIHTTTSILNKNIILKKLINNHNFHYGKVLYIGDEVRDIIAAKRIGIKVVSVTWGYNSAAALEKLTPDFLINDPQELFNICKNLE